MSKEMEIKQECCNIWNNLKDKTKMIDYLIESKQQIADLEAKLEESEKRIKDLEFRNKNLEHLLKVAPNANAGQRARIVELKGINHQLKKELVEKQSKIQELNDMYEDLLVAKGTENELMQVSADCDFFAKENRKLKQQLAEKEKEIEDIKLCRCVNCTNEYEFMLEGLVGDLERQLDKCDQDKISFAVERLNLLKSQIIEWRKLYKGKFSEFSNGVKDALSDVEEEIDNQIEELKKELNK